MLQMDIQVFIQYLLYSNEYKIGSRYIGLWIGQYSKVLIMIQWIRYINLLVYLTQRLDIMLTSTKQLSEM
jgi:hypothetical protein